MAPAGKAAYAAIQLELTGFGKAGNKVCPSAIY